MRYCVGVPWTTLGTGICDEDPRTQQTIVLLPMVYTETGQQNEPREKVWGPVGVGGSGASFQNPLPVGCPKKRCDSRQKL